MLSILADERLTLLIESNMDLFDCPVGGILAHGCNTLGVMGRGVALTFKQRFPAAFQFYVEHCARKQPVLGDVIYYIGEATTACLFTQSRIGGIRPASLKAIEESLDNCLRKGLEWNRDVYAPRLGCGLGGLRWADEVKPIYKRVAEAYPKINLIVCTPPEVR